MNQIPPCIMRTNLLLTGLLSVLTASAASPDYQSKHLAIGLSPDRPAFTCFAVDSLGQGKLELNPVLVETNAVTVPGLELKERFVYTLNGKPAWRISCSEQTLTLRSDYIPGVEIPPFTLSFDQKANHATLLGLMKPGERRMSLPCVLHLPDMGSLRINANSSRLMLDYDALRSVRPSFVRISFPAATAQQRHVQYRLEVTAIYPRLAGIEKDSRYDGFRRDFLNIFQVNPRLQMLANNSGSDPCAFTLFEYAEVARHAPPLADGLTCLDLIRMTLDHYLDGAAAYGWASVKPTPPNCGLIPHPMPYSFLDSHPSLIIAACEYVEGSNDRCWARTNYARLLAWTREMMATDKDGNGLIEYPRSGNYGDRPGSTARPANWWDTINFGHEDAYANALAYRACVKFTALARRLGHDADDRVFTVKAEALRTAYVATFLNPDSGVLAGWRSADGQLHDYWFTFVQGVAISYGLVDENTANAIMDRLLKKMAAVGYTNFELGLPGNLVPVKKGDYVDHDTPPEVHGVPKQEDGSDGFQFYENGGTSGCFAGFTLKALYQLHRAEDARQILYPMLAGYAAGQFQGFGENGQSRDWRDWKGGCHGYEGLLVDNYHALLAVLDDVKAPRRPLQQMEPGQCNKTKPAAGR